MVRNFILLRKAWNRYEPAILLIGTTGGLLVWAYSNFATASEVHEMKADLHAYVDHKNADVSVKLDDHGLVLQNIQIELRAQHKLMDDILLHVKN